MVINKRQLIRLCASFLKFYDARPIVHGERVAYIAVKLLENMEVTHEANVHDLLQLALFHDIGAYKTDEIDRMMRFETVNVARHSIYGYVFIKHFTPLKDLAAAVLYHHANVSMMGKLEPVVRTYAQLIRLADCMDLALVNNIPQDTYLTRFSRMDMGPEVLVALEKLLAKEDLRAIFVYEKLSQWIVDQVAQNPITDDAAKQYVQMIVDTIDFKSEATVLHSVNTVIISTYIGKQCGLTEEELEELYYGALIHDVGKVAIPDEILEYPGRLSPEQMEIMREHVVYTEAIIGEIVPEKIVRIAVRHHEKLDGSGYPYGLAEDQLSLSERIVAVADVVSALVGRRSYKEGYSWDRVLTILKEMADGKLLDAQIVAIIITNYEALQAVMEEKGKPVQQRYEAVQEEYTRLAAYL